MIETLLDRLGFDFASFLIGVLRKSTALQNVGRKVQRDFVRDGAMEFDRSPSDECNCFLTC